MASQCVKRKMSGKCCEIGLREANPCPYDAPEATFCNLKSRHRERKTRPFGRVKAAKTNLNYGFSLPQKGLCHEKKAARKAQNGHATLHTFAQNRITNDVSTRYSCTRIFNEFPPNQKTFATDAIPNVKMKCNKKGRNGIHVAFCHSRKPCRASRRGRQRPSH